MKIRQGFVSNSSSSSFVILGKKFKSLYDIEASLDKTQKIEDQNICVIGDACLGDGEDIFKLTDEIYNELYCYPTNYKRYIDFFQAKCVLYGDDDTVHDPILEPFQCYSGERDMHSTDSLEMFRQRYIRGGIYDE